jgi:hypothetical protein
MPYPMPASESHSISLSVAKKMISSFRSSKETLFDARISKVSDALANCETFNKNAFKSFFDNDDVKGIRIYYGLCAETKIHAIIVGTDADGNDILPDKGGEILEEGLRCPTYCPPTSLLNEI